MRPGRRPPCEPLQKLALIEPTPIPPTDADPPVVGAGPSTDGGGVAADDRRPGPSGVASSRPRRRGQLKEKLIEWALFACALTSVVVTVAIFVVLFNESVYSFFGPSAGEGQGVQSTDGERYGAFFQGVTLSEFLTDTRWSPTYPGEGQHFGILPLVVGTLMVTGIAAVVGLPIGLLSAVYLSEYASVRVRRVVKPILEILAGVPTVVYGFFALAFVTPYVLKPVLQGGLGIEVDTYNAVSAGFVVGVMVIPMVCSLSEDALRAVPVSLREAGHALGAGKVTVTLTVVVPAAISGIAASFLLAIARAIGETMAVALAAGNSPSVALNPLQSHQTMTGFIAAMGGTDAVHGTIEYNSLYAVALCLFVATFVLNLISALVTRRFREVYQ